MRKFVVALAFGGLLALALGASPAAASHSWGSYHWERSANPLTIDIGENLTPAWQGILGDVSADWNASSVLNLTVVDGHNGNPKRCKAVSGRVQACNAKYGFNGWLGLAQIWVEGSHIQKAVTKVNDSYFNTSTYNDPNAKRHVLCQEIGHDFGLHHQNSATSESCMDGNGLFDPAFFSPNQHDYDQLETIYLHLDTSEPKPPKKGKGRPNKRQRRVSKTLYVKDFGNGKKLFTWVSWAR